jgi:threonine dehydratase
MGCCLTAGHKTFCRRHQDATGLSSGLAAKLTGMAASILVPHGNNLEKNKAMRALGVDLIEYGDDFQEAAEHAQTLADGVVCRSPNELAVKTILDGAADIITVSEDEIISAMACYFTDTHNVAEGAAPLAALLQRKADFAGNRVGLILSGGNADKALMMRVLKKAGDQR